MKKLAFFTSLALILVFTSCEKRFPCVHAKSETTKETRSVESFSGVELRMSANVYITQDVSLDGNEVIVEASENLLDHIETKVSGSTLIIDTKRCIRGHGDINVYIKTKDMNDISLSGSGDIIALNTLTPTNMNLEISGSGNIDASLNVQTTNMKISGSGNITCTGKTNSLDVNISGSGNISSFDLKSSSATINISGSGNTYVNVSDQLNVTISGSGNVYYIGHPDIHQNISGSGNIINNN